MRRRQLANMQVEQDTRNRSPEILARLIPAIRLTQNDSGSFQGETQSSPAGSVPPAPPVLITVAEVTGGGGRGWPKGKKRGPRKAP